MDKYCFSLVCVPDVEEKLLDALLTVFNEEIFTSTPTCSHGTAMGRLSPAEQVMGRSRSVLVQILVSDPEMQTLLTLLADDFAGTGIRYWATPLTLEGEVA
jgi:hypothetical protein